MDQNYASGRMRVPSSSVEWALLPRAAGGGLQPSLLGKQSQGESLQLILIVREAGERGHRAGRQRKARAELLVLLGHTDRLHSTYCLSEWL